MHTHRNGGKIPGQKVRCRDSRQRGVLHNSDAEKEKGQQELGSRPRETEPTAETESPATSTTYSESRSKI